MSTFLKSVANRFEEHRRAFYGAGGKPRSIKYPLGLRQNAAEVCRQLPEIGLSKLAKMLGVSQGALTKWCKNESKSVAVGPLAFVPVGVIEGPPAVKEQLLQTTKTKHGQGICLSWRDIRLDIDDRADAAFVATLVSALSKVGGLTTC